jgi:hypothetical protein
MFFLSISLKFILSLVSRGLGSLLFKVILVGTGVQLKLRKHPNANIAIKWGPEFTCYNLFDNLDAIG